MLPISEVFRNVVKENLGGGKFSKFVLIRSFPLLKEFV